MSIASFLGNVFNQRALGSSAPATLQRLGNAHGHIRTGGYFFIIFFFQVGLIARWHTSCHVQSASLSTPRLPWLLLQTHSRWIKASSSYRSLREIRSQSKGPESDKQVSVMMTDVTQHALVPIQLQLLPKSTVIKFDALLHQHGNLSKAARPH